jgi:hypothetical protein
MVTMFLSDLRYAARRLIREPRFTLAAVLTLALGVGANVAVFAVVEAVLLRPLGYPEADRLVTLNHRDERTGITKPFNAIGDYVDFAERQKSFDAFGAYGSGEATIFGMGDPFRVSVLVVTAGAPPWSCRSPETTGPCRSSGPINRSPRASARPTSAGSSPPGGSSARWKFRWWAGGSSTSGTPRPRRRW